MDSHSISELATGEFHRNLLFNAEQSLNPTEQAMPAAGGYVSRAERSVGGCEHAIHSLTRPPPECSMDPTRHRRDYQYAWSALDLILARPLGAGSRKSSGGIATGLV